jgi:type VII secretion-associated serine protease mycosin
VWHLIAALALAASSALLADPSPSPSLSSLPDSSTDKCIGPSSVVAREVPWQQQLDPASVWHLTRGEGVIVAVLDSGVSAAAPALNGRVLRGLDVAKSGPADNDCLGHGTFVAGIIAAAPTEGVGFTGMAPAARILPIRIVPDTGKITADLIADGVVEAVTRGASVIDISVGVTEETTYLRNALAYAEAMNVVVVIGVDDGIWQTSTTYNQNDLRRFPGVYSTVVAVNGVGQDGTTTLGEPDPQSIRVDLVAPGAGVQSISVSGPGHYAGTGATFAAGFVAGTAALVRAYHPNLTAGQVRERLYRTADRFGKAIPSAEFGYGVVDPYEAVAAILPEEQGATAAPVQGHMPKPERPVPPDGTPATAAWFVVGGVAAALVVFGAVAAVGRWGRRRPTERAGQPPRRDPWG